MAGVARVEATWPAGGVPKSTHTTRLAVDSHRQNSALEKRLDAIPHICITRDIFLPSFLLIVS